MYPSIFVTEPTMNARPNVIVSLRRLFACLAVNALLTPFVFSQTSERRTLSLNSLRLPSRRTGSRLRYGTVIAGSGINQSIKDVPIHISILNAQYLADFVPTQVSDATRFAVSRVSLRGRRQTGPRTVEYASIFVYALAWMRPQKISPLHPNNCPKSL
jgi:hypothetical protein